MDGLSDPPTCVRGFKNVSFFLMCAVQNLAAVKLLHYYILPKALKTV